MVNFPTSDTQFLAKTIEKMLNGVPVSEPERDRLRQLASEGHSTEPLPAPGGGGS